MTAAHAVADVTPADIEQAYAQLGERKWSAVCAADTDRDLTAVTKSAFAYLIHTLDADRSLTTGDAMVALERRLRTEHRNTYCIAKRTVAPQRSFTYGTAQPTEFHLYFTCQRKSDAKRERDEVAGGREENLRRLAACGFLDRYTDAEEAEQRKRAVALPPNLKPEHTATHGGHRSAPTFNVDSVARYCQSMLLDCAVLLPKLHAHAADVCRGEPSTALQGTGVQVLRTSVPRDRWQRTCTALDDSVQRRLPMAESTLGIIRTGLVPIGYQWIGWTCTENDEDEAFFDLYLVQEPQFVLQLNDEQRARIAAQTTNTALRQVVSSLVGVRADDLAHVTVDNVWNYFAAAVAAPPSEPTAAADSSSP